MRQPFEAVVTVAAGIAFPALTSGKENVRHLPSRREMQRLISLGSSSHKFFEKSAEWLADDCVLLRWIHAVAMKLDEQPVRPPLDADPRPFPE